MKFRLDAIAGSRDEACRKRGHTTKRAHMTRFFSASRSATILVRGSSERPLWCKTLPRRAVGGYLSKFLIFGARPRRRAVRPHDEEASTVSISITASVSAIVNSFDASTDSTTAWRVW
jgi:hypothetical protein